MKLNILITCSQRKQLDPESRYCLQSLSSVEDQDEKCREWISRLEEERQPRISAHELYQGEHWSVGVGLPGVAEDRGFDVQLWVCSAGYGLIRQEHQIQPYAATFSGDKPDSVGRTQEQWQAWWKGLSEWGGPTPETPRSIEGLVASDAEAILLLVASESYLKAMQHDVTAALARIKESERFLILSSGTEKLGEALTPHLLPANARLQHLVGGARQALNVRIARWILSQSNAGSLTLASLRPVLQAAIDEQPELPKYDNQSQTDAQIATFIREALLDDPDIARTPLLGRLRDLGFACEQNRFRSLFLEVEEEIRKERALTLFDLD